METNETLVRFLNNEEMALSDSVINELSSQIKDISRLLIIEENLEETEARKIAFYSFLKFLAKLRTLEIKIDEYDKLIADRKIKFEFEIRHFENRIDFLEKLYSKVIPPIHKKIYGQFFTPKDVAEFMVAVGLSYRPQKVLDPAGGGGIFFSCFNNTHDDLSFNLIEKDSLCLEMAKINLSRLKNINVKFFNSDFLKVTTGKYDLIIANPPYIRFHDISNREESISEIEAEINQPLSRLINYYALFFFHSHNLLEEGGRLIFITPSEFLNVNYGKSVKEFLKKRFDIEAIITLESGALLFDEGLSTACITILTKRSVPSKNNVVKFIRLSKWHGKEAVMKILKDPKNLSNKIVFMNLLKQTKLNYKEKWSKYFDNGFKDKSHLPNLIKLSEVASVTRGIATGANNYFVLSKSKADKSGIEESFFKPVIAKANYCKYRNFTSADLAELIRLDKPTFLLYCFETPTPNLNEYVKHGEKNGIHTRFLTSKRKPWYSMEKRPPAPIWAAVFSRLDIKFLLNEANCLNLTTFHGIYPKFTENNKIIFLTAFLNSKICKELMKYEMRSYGGGLNKFEPKDLENILVPNIDRIPTEKINFVANLFSDYLRKDRKGDSTEQVKTEMEKEFSNMLQF